MPMHAGSKGQPGLEQLRHDALVRMFEQFIRVRRIAPLGMLAVGLTVAIADGAVWRIVAVVLIVAAALFWSWLDIRRFQGGTLSPSELPRTLVLLAVSQLAALTVLGGIDCPALGAVLVLTVIVTHSASIRLGRLIIAAQITAIWAMAAMRLGGLAPGLNPSVFGGEIHATYDASRTISTAFVLTFLLLGTRQVGLRVKANSNENLERTVSARDEALRGYAEQMRELNLLSGEIAHELKNPLASIKGLAILITRELEGKPAERMAVLRREVDRMQGILEEFLDFSRPLVPLSIERVDLAKLTAEVVELHEGLAGERRVTIRLSAGAACAECDPRKMKQILLNLLQNAIDASPEGGRIAVRIESHEREAVIRVRDHGPGLAAEVAGHVFEPGITTKEGGSGLGLTVARALARQHGGELTLVNAPEGGCEATLRLPVRFPRAEAADKRGEPEGALEAGATP